MNLLREAKRKLKIAVAMSGGVDSAVAAKLLKDQGHKVVGIFLHFWREQPPLTKGGRGDLNFGLSTKVTTQAENKCCSTQALLDARRVAAKIGIPLYTLNFAKIFKKQVVDNFLDEYKNGRTPNPCVRCNKLVKLGLLIKQAKKLGFDYVATGHYVKKSKVKSLKLKVKYKLYKARDENKDQSYFLYTLSQDELKHLIFPLGNYTKPRVRRMAKKFGLPVAEKPESQEVCFIPDKNHNEFLKRHLKLKPGPIIALPPNLPPARTSQEGGVKNKFNEKISLSRDDRSGRGQGEGIGRHQGLPLYTIGQRKGIEIGGTGPYYAAKMDYKKNILYVVNDAKSPLLYNNRLMAKNVSWLAGAEPKLPLKCQAVIRYHHRPAECVITKINPRAKFSARVNKNNFEASFFEPQRAITSGQSVVFYSGQEILGGGIIA